MPTSTPLPTSTPTSTPPDYPASPRTVTFKGQQVPVLRLEERFRLNGGAGVTCSNKTYYGTPATEGHAGYTTSDIIAEPPGWLSQLADQNRTPDIVVMHLGTNNFWRGYVAPPSTLTDYTTIVGRLRATNPNVKINVAQIIPWLLTATTEKCTTDLDAAIPYWRDSITTAQSPVYVVDLNTGFDPAFVAEDGFRCHPNSDRAKWMADTVFPVLASLL